MEMYFKPADYKDALDFTSQETKYDGVYDDWAMCGYPKSPLDKGVSTVVSELIEKHSDREDFEETELKEIVDSIVNTLLTLIGQNEYYAIALDGKLHPFILDELKSDERLSGYKLLILGKSPVDGCEQMNVIIYDRIR